MTLAHRLRAAGVQPTILEALARARGTGLEPGDRRLRWDRFYHVILLSDRELLGLLEELGLADQLHWGYTRSGFFTDGAFHSLSSSSRLPDLPAARPGGQGAAGVRRSSTPPGSRMALPLERETAAAWLTRWSGPANVRAALAAAAPEQAGRERGPGERRLHLGDHRAHVCRPALGLKREMFGYVDGGYATILPRFREVLTPGRSRVRLRAARSRT